MDARSRIYYSSWTYSAVGVLGAGSVGEDPVQLGGDPGVHPGVLGHGTPVPPAHHPGHGEQPVLLHHQRAAGVSLTGVLPLVSSADHVVGDPTTVGRVALVVGLDGDLDLVEDLGLVDGKSDFPVTSIHNLKFNPSSLLSQVFYNQGTTNQSSRIFFCVPSVSVSGYIVIFFLPSTLRMRTSAQHPAGQ